MAGYRMKSMTVLTYSCTAPALDGKRTVNVTNVPERLVTVSVDKFDISQKEQTKRMLILARDESRLCNPTGMSTGKNS